MTEQTGFARTAAELDNDFSAGIELDGGVVLVSPSDGEPATDLVEDEDAPYWRSVEQLQFD